MPAKVKKTAPPAATKAEKKPAAKPVAPKSAAKAAPKPGASDLPATTRRFRTLGQKRVGMLFSGGPAPGANAVISTATIQFLNDHFDVVGFYKGYEFLEKFDRNNPTVFKEGMHFARLNYTDVTKIRQQGGCMLRTSRANPSKLSGQEIRSVKDLSDPAKARKLYNVLDALEYLGISSLISIGGDDTLKTAYYLSLLGVPVVHVPKTIDNDYYGIPWTFGYFSAIERARQDVKIYNNEVRTTECYFILELMGRKAGWYTLGAGIAGEAVRMIGPEETGDTLDLDKLTEELVDLILMREQLNKNYGVILVSEGLVDKLPVDKKPKTTDAHGNVTLSEAKIGELIGSRVKKRYKERTGRSLTLKNSTIGYTTRCIEPSAFDVLLGSQLGMGAYQFIKAGNFAHMVSVGDNLEIKRVPFSELIDGTTFKTRVRYVPIDGDFFKLAKSLEFKAVKRGIGDIGLM
ncbi:MAG: 6-phosphofructokinase [Myxococcales bacterium]|nr:MAG: 6-phosphofructokinase [Myxococcales bacterium]